MIMAATKALANLSPTVKDRNAPLLPPIADSREISRVIAEAVGKQAIAEGVSTMTHPSALKRKILDYVWEPAYLPYERIG